MSDSGLLLQFFDELPEVEVDLGVECRVVGHADLAGREAKLLEKVEPVGDVEQRWAEPKLGVVELGLGSTDTTPGLADSCQLLPRVAESTLDSIENSTSLSSKYRRLRLSLGVDHEVHLGLVVVQDGCRVRRILQRSLRDRGWEEVWEQDEPQVGARRESMARRYA